MSPRKVATYTMLALAMVKGALGVLKLGGNERP
jgi:hypothetical protein